MALPNVDFKAIADIAHEALQSYGTLAIYTEHDTAYVHNVRTVIYKAKPSFPMINDTQSQDELALLDPQDFKPPARWPQRFDTISISQGGYVGVWALWAEPQPIYAGNELPIFIAEIRRD